MRIGISTILLAATLLHFVGSAQGQDNIPALVDQARQAFKPVATEQVSTARNTLKQRMSELERYVNPSSANGKNWIAFLKWDDLKQALAAEGAPKLDALDVTLDRLNRDESGLEQSKFRAVADALRRYRDLAAVSQWQDPASIYGQQLEGLSKTLEQFRKEPTPANEVALSAPAVCTNAPAEVQVSG